MVFFNGNGNDGLLLLLIERPFDLSAVLTLIILVSLNLDEKYEYTQTKKSQLKIIVKFKKIYQNGMHFKRIDATTTKKNYNIANGMR